MPQVKEMDQAIQRAIKDLNMKATVDRDWWTLTRGPYTVYIDAVFGTVMFKGKKLCVFFWKTEEELAAIVENLQWKMQFNGE